MRERFLGSVLLVAFITALPAAADEKGKGAGAKDRIDADKLPPGVYTGQLKSVPSAKDRDFVVRIEYDRLEVKDPKGLARAKGQLAGLVNQINRVQADMARSRNPEAQLGRLQGLTARLQRDSANVQQNYFRTVPERKEVTFHAADDLVVRLRRPPTEFDEKGKVKQFTPDELKARKGKHPDLPGYEAKAEDLKVGQVVRVTQGRPGGPGAAPGGARGKERGEAVKEKDKDPKPRATMVLILADGPDDASASKLKGIK